jgi:hypothetical protein
MKTADLIYVVVWAFIVVRVDLVYRGVRVEKRRPQALRQLAEGGESPPAVGILSPSGCSPRVGRVHWEVVENDI